MSFSSFHPVTDTNGENTVTTAATVSTEAPNPAHGEAPPATTTTTTTFDRAASSSSSPPLQQPDASFTGVASRALIAGFISMGAFAVAIIMICKWRKFMRRHDGHGHHVLGRRRWGQGQVRGRSNELSRADVCLFCSRKMPTVEVGTKQSNFCSEDCSMDTLSRVPIGNAIYTEVVNSFTKQWKHRMQKLTDQCSILFRHDIHSDKMCSFGRSMGISLCLSDSLCTRWKWNAAWAFPVGIHAAAFMVLSENAPWGTPPVMTTFAGNQVAICVGSSSSFHLAHAGMHMNFLRFGKGIYMSVTSSKAIGQ